jgi:2-C-methyl-D-erythritol 4-phosphate cytidylyltransferase
MKKYAVLVAGGSGSRMKSDVPKQFILLKNKPLLVYTIESFLEADADINIILVLPEHYLETGKKIITQFFSSKEIIITSGGATRFHSVKNGLKKIHEDGIVLVHDAVRSMVAADLIKRSLNEVLVKKAIIPAIPSKDSVRIIDGDKNKSISRDTVMLIQTPQTFFSEDLKKAFEVEYNDTFTDEASVMEAAGFQIHIISGDENNIKITHPIDLIIAEKILDNPQ